MPICSSPDCLDAEGYKPFFSDPRAETEFVFAVPCKGHYLHAVGLHFGETFHLSAEVAPPSSVKTAAVFPAAVIRRSRSRFSLAPRGRRFFKLPAEIMPDNLIIVPCILSADRIRKKDGETLTVLLPRRRFAKGNLQLVGIHIPAVLQGGG